MKFQQLREALKTDDSSKLINIISQLRDKHPFSGVVLLLSKLHEQSDNPLVLSEIENFLNDLHNQDFTGEVIEAIDNAKDDITRQKLISSCWQSGLDYSSYLRKFAEYAINESYMVTLECYSVIEQWASYASDKDKKDCLDILSNHPGNHSGDKKRLVEAIIMAI